MIMSRMPVRNLTALPQLYFGAKSLLVMWEAAQIGRDRTA